MPKWVMDNAIWLITMAPQWFFSSVMNPLHEGFASAVPAAGAYFLAIGVLLSLFFWRKQLLLFLIPLVISVGVIAGAGYMRGAFRELTVIEPSLIAFVCIQALLAVYLAFKAEGARLPGTALAVFSVSHALFVSKIATMSLTNNWV